MIVVDTSALLAIYFAEAEAERFERFFHGAGQRVLAAPTLLELHMAASRRPNSHVEVPLLVSRLELRTVEWTGHHAMIAVAAFRLYGKGRGHPAQLNFGDCMSYALARALDAPLLYKGEDFAMTDIRAAL